MNRCLIISTAVDLVRIAPDRIVCFSSDGNYSTLVQADSEMRTVGLQLGQIAQLIDRQLTGTDRSTFIRVGKSLIINRSFIYYINVPKQKLTLSDATSFSHTVTASREALKQLKDFLDGEGQCK